MEYYKRQPLEKFDISKSFGPMAELGFFVDSESYPLDFITDKFSFVNAWWAAEFCRLSYVKNSKQKIDILKKVGFDSVVFFSREGTDCFVAYNKNIVIVTFTGTELDEGFEDLLIDVEFWPSRWDYGKGLVHKGFERGFKKVWKDVEALIKPLILTRQLWYCGHSLGGALAILAASALPGDAAYVFGCPRVGNRTFTKNIRTPVYRIAKNRDIVTRIPTPPIYRHVGEYYFIQENGEVLRNPDWISMFYDRLGGNEWKILFLLLKLIICRSGMDFILSYFHSHSPYNYSVFMWNNFNTEFNDIDINTIYYPMMI